MSELRNDSLETFLEELASEAPAPGGGAAAGICGAMGAALASMVGNLTIGKKRYVAVEAEMQKLVEDAAKARLELLTLAEQDRQAFLTVMAAYKLPKDTPEAEAKRAEAIQKACKIAAMVPLQVAKVCVDVLLLAQKAVHDGNYQIVSDGAAACLLARAALRISSYNVRVNLNLIKDRSFNTQIGNELNKHEHHAAILESTILREADQVILNN